MTTRLIVAMVLVAMAAGPAHAERDRVELMSEAAVRSNAGDHIGAIELYEEVYRADGDVELFLIIGSEQRKVGMLLDAIRYYCTYLTIEPSGVRARFAAGEVWAMQAELGNQVPNTNVCARGVPLISVRTSASPVKQAVTKDVRSISTREQIGLGAAALGVVSLGASLYFGYQARGISDQISSHSPNTPWPDDIAALEERGVRAESRQAALFITGGLALVTGGVLYLSGRANRLSTERVSITPSVSQTGGGVAMSGGF